MRTEAIVDGEAGAPERLLIDGALGSFHERVAAHRIVDADPVSTWSAARRLDFLEVETPILTASFWLRGLPEKVTGRAAPPPASLRLADGSPPPGWVSLGEQEGFEVAFGAVGVFWTPIITWHDSITSEAFAAFDEPGWGKIACSLSALPYGADRSLLTYECRVATTDAASARRFRRYWWAVRPFVGHIMRATVATIGRRADEADEVTLA